MTGRSATASGNEPGIAEATCWRRRRPGPSAGSAGVPWNGPGSLAVGRYRPRPRGGRGDRHRPPRATRRRSSLRPRPARCRRSGRTRTPAAAPGRAPSRTHGPDRSTPGTRRRADRGSVRASARGQVSTKLTRASQPRNVSRIAPPCAGSTRSRWCTGRGRRWPGGTWSAIPRAAERRRRARSARCRAKGSTATGDKVASPRCADPSIGNFSAADGRPLQR